MLIGTTLFAADQSDKVDQALRSPDFWVAVGLLCGLLLAAAAVLYAVDRWRKRGEAPGHEPVESLTSFRSRGELTDAEYQRIRAKLATRMKGGSAVPAAADRAKPAGGGDPPAAGPPPET